jgi:hypothetical protein
MFKGLVTYDEFVEVSEYEFEMIRHYKLKKCFVNLREMSAYPTGGQDYVKNIWFPRVIKEGIQMLAFVVPDDIFVKVSMVEAHDPQGTLTIQYFDEENRALAWLADSKFYI